MLAVPWGRGQGTCAQTRQDPPWPLLRSPRAGHRRVTDQSRGGQSVGRQALGQAGASTLVSTPRQAAGAPDSGHVHLPPGWCGCLLLTSVPGHWLLRWSLSRGPPGHPSAPQLQWGSWWFWSFPGRLVLAARPRLSEGEPVRLSAWPHPTAHPTPVHIARLSVGWCLPPPRSWPGTPSSYFTLTTGSREATWRWGN